MSTAIEQIEMSLTVLDKREAELTVLAESAKDITITGPEDKEGYKIVREKRIELKNARISVQNDGKDLRENAVKFQKTVIAREKQLIAIIAEEESRLSNAEDQYDKWQEEARIKREREENERIQKRIDSLAKFSYALDLYEAKVMPEEDFQALLGHAEAGWKKEQEMLESKRIEDERLKAEALEAQRLYEERIKKESEELERKKAEYEAQRKADLELAERAKKEREYIEEQQRKENERIRKEQEAEAAKIRAEREAFEAEKRKADEEKRIEQAKLEAAEKARIEEQARVKREADEKAERERKATEEAERQEALKPDKEKLLTFAEGLPGIPCPKINDIAAANILDVAFDKIEEIREFIKKEIQKL